MLNWRFFCLFLLATGASLAFAEANTVVLRVDCPNRGNWRLSADESFARNVGGTETCRIALDCDVPSVPPKFEVTFSVPQVEMQHVWAPKSELFKIEPDWGIAFNNFVSELALDLPVYAVFDDANSNRLTVACSEVLRPVRFHAGVREEGSFVRVLFRFFEKPDVPMTHWETTIRLDRRSRFWSEAVSEASDWVTAASGARPQRAPEAAFEPLYSSWYSFHQDVTDKALEAECALAAKLGMKTLIVDDGWQTDDTNRGYAFCGDWQVLPRRFPDMAAHVARVQALGIKYMMWYGVPFVGKNSKAWPRFQGKFLRVNERLGTAVLDPRFPEVRAYLAGLYETAVRDWNLDGFKLDFIDQFKVHDGAEDPAVAENWKGRDFKTVPDATHCLMTNVTARLKALKPGMLIEFRQSYIGPKIREYGNMIRASDCPGDMQANRMRTFNLRLTSAGSAVHADMLEWHPDETAESAARYVLNVIFSTVQYSMMLRNLPESHLRMVRHWIAFSKEHLATLQKGAFRPYWPQSGYPLAVAEGASERIAAVYNPDVVVRLTADRAAYVLNGTPSVRLILKLERAPQRAEAFDTFGASAGPRRLQAGFNEVDVPASGYLKIEF